jgi:phosphomannomutase
VYWANGCQIIPPHDAGIAAAIKANLNLWTLPETLDTPLLSDPLQNLTEHYFTQLRSKLCFCKDLNPSSQPVVYTPLHGVGLKAVQRAFQEFHLPQPIVVEQQAEPNPEFPTVSFPNPEEGKGTWKLAFDKATATGTRLVIANDPDADRLAAAEQVEGRPGSFQTFSGNDIGLLLADWVWSNTRKRRPEVREGGGVRGQGSDLGREGRGA